MLKIENLHVEIEDGYIRKVKGNSYMEDLTSGNAVAGITWSGDIFILAYDTEDPNWTFTIPESGGTLWSDNMMVPITSTHRRNAQRLMDYYYDPAVAAGLVPYAIGSETSGSTSGTSSSQARRTAETTDPTVASSSRPGTRSGG